MATYKDMIELIGKFKHVPEVIANPNTAYTKFNPGGQAPQVNPAVQFGYGGLASGQGVSQGFTDGSGGVQTNAGYNPYNVSMNAGNGSILSGSSAGESYTPEGMASGAGGGYAGLTPYDGGSIMNNSLISQRVTSFKKGGRMYFDGGKKKDDTVEEFQYTSFDKLTTAQQESLLTHFTNTEGYTPSGHLVTPASGITFGSGLDAKALITEQDYIDHGVSAADAKTIVDGLKYTKKNGDVYDMSGKSSLEIQTDLGLTEDELKAHVGTIKFTNTTQKDIVSKSVDKMYTNNTDLFDKTSNFEDFTSLSSIVHFTGDSHFESGAINRNTSGDTKRAVQITMYELMQKTDGKLTSQEYNNILQQTKKVVDDQGGIGTRTETSHPGDASATFNRWNKELDYSTGTLDEGYVYDETKYHTIKVEDYGGKGSSDEKFTTIYDATFVETESDVVPEGTEGTNVTPTQDTNANLTPTESGNPYTLNSSSDHNVNGNTTQFNSNTNVIEDGTETDIQLNQTMVDGVETNASQTTGISQDGRHVQEVVETGEETTTVEVGPFLKYGGKLKATPYEDGGKTDEEKKEEIKRQKYYKTRSSSERGSFPGMKNENIINADLNKDGFIAISMAREYGYTGSINMTSGERLSKDQWRVMMQNQYPQDMGLYSRNFRAAVNDSIDTHGYNTDAGNEQIVDWIDSQYELYVAGELDESDLPSQHMIGNAGDFTGSFKRWLSSSDSKEYRKAFGLGVLNESDHFHVKFNKIDVEGFDVSKGADYANYESMFNKLAVENEKGEMRISMNPLDHDEGVMSNALTPLPIQDAKFDELPAPELATLNPPPGYEDYQTYRNEATEKQQQSFGYRINEKLGNMENYSPKEPILSYEDWGVQNNVNTNTNTAPVVENINTSQQTVPMPTQGAALQGNGFVQQENPYGVEGLSKNILGIYNDHIKPNTLDKMLPEGQVFNGETLPEISINGKIPTQEQYGQLLHMKDVEDETKKIFSMINPYGR